MNARLDAGLFLLSILLALNGVQRARSLSATASSESSSTSIVTGRPPLLPSVDSLEEDAATITVNDPFRLANRPPGVRFSPTSLATPSPVPVRPFFTVRAIIGGPPWSALLEGIPGQSGGVIVSAGNTFDKLRIRSITRDTVVMQSPDTTWKLTMKANP